MISKRVEMLFAHLKAHLATWAICDCAAHAVRQIEFTLAAIAQNLRRLAKLVARPPPAMPGVPSRCMSRASLDLTT